MAAFRLTVPAVVYPFVAAAGGQEVVVRRRPADRVHRGRRVTPQLVGVGARPQVTQGHRRLLAAHCR